jgi:predicted acetyltransferase
MKERLNTPDDSIKIRFATEEDLQTVYENQARAYGISVAPGDVEGWKRKVELEDILVAEDVSDPRRPFLVATSLCYKLRLTVPGGTSLRAAWLAMVTVAATHEGRGIWQQISIQGFGILQDRGYPFICGVPTQPTVYDILGAGVASYHRTYNIDRRFAKLRGEPLRKRARELNAAEARSEVPPIYERWCGITHGSLARDSAWWDDYLEDRVTQRDNGSELNFIIHPDGFLTYRVMGGKPHAFRPPFGTLVVQDFCAITDEAHTELLATLLSLESFNDIEIELPVDDPLPLKLRDPRPAQTAGISDFLWLRIMNVPDVLGKRIYSADVEVVLEVTDPLVVAGGRYLLQTRDGIGTCAPHDGRPDIRIGLAELGTVYMGAHSVSELHAADRITELRSGALVNLEAAFSTQRAPYSGTLF